MEPFKNLLNPALVLSTGARLKHVHAGFDRALFERVALQGLDALELKGRCMQIAQALMVALPHATTGQFSHACDVIEAALAPPVPVQGISTARGDVSGGLVGWIVWPLGEFVAGAGLARPERSLQALHALTQRLTAEFSIRPFIVAHPERVFATLQHWTQDPSAHVRRLASEGSRPRLPWGLRLQSLVLDPSPTLPILAALQDDPSDYVRRSVANHWNDIAKDHPGLLVRWVQENLAGATVERAALLRHASRTLVKRGHVPMLDVWGVGRPFEGQAALRLSSKRCVVGDTLTLTMNLKSGTSMPQKLVIDYAVHHVMARGSSSAKVFKGWTTTLDAGERKALVKTHSLRPVSIRTYRAGTHRIELLVNGTPCAESSFELRV